MEKTVMVSKCNPILEERKVGLEMIIFSHFLRDDCITCSLIEKGFIQSYQVALISSGFLTILLGIGVLWLISECPRAKPWVYLKSNHRYC